MYYPDCPSGHVIVSRLHNIIYCQNEDPIRVPSVYTLTIKAT